MRPIASLTGSPVPAIAAPRVLTDPDLLAGVVEDASHFPGRVEGLVRPTSGPEVAAALAQAAREGVPVLAIGAQSSLTGGAVPIGDRVISTAGLTQIGPVAVLTRDISGVATRAHVTVGAGVMLADLQAAVGRDGWYYPPVPTYQQACIGGTVSTNAAGSATFKYGPTRPWVRRLRVLTVEGFALDIARGQHVVSAGGTFEIALPDGRVRRVPAPDYPMPRVKKCSMGYWSARELDLIDLFIGSEGTLGVIVEVEVELVPQPAGVLAALVFARSESQALELVHDLRVASQRTWQNGSGLDVRAIEHMDGASLDLVRARGAADRLKVALPHDARMALYLEVELQPGDHDDSILADLEASMDGGFERAPVTASGEIMRTPESANPSGPRNLFATLARHDLLDRLELALPGDPSRIAAFREVREAVPIAVNETVRERQRTLDAAIHKLGGDMCVPFEQFERFLARQRTELAARGLEYAVFGHVSDGNVHPNVLARSAAEMAAGEDALLAIATVARDFGGSPLAEHGVGRNPLKQRMLADYRGSDGMAAMRAVKRALDPEGRLARGVLFPPET